MSTPEPYPYRKLNYPVNNLAQDFNATEKDQVRQNIGIPSSVNKTGKVLKVNDNTGNLSWEDESGGTVTDVKVNGTSVVSDGVASVTVPTNTSDLNNDSGYLTSADVPKDIIYVDISTAYSFNQVFADWDAFQHAILGEGKCVIGLDWSTGQFDAYYLTRFEDKDNGATAIFSRIPYIKSRSIEGATNYSSTNGVKHFKVVKDDNVTYKFTITREGFDQDIYNKSTYDAQFLSTSPYDFATKTGSPVVHGPIPYGAVVLTPGKMYRCILSYYPQSTDTTFDSTHWEETKFDMAIYNICKSLADVDTVRICYPATSFSDISTWLSWQKQCILIDTDGIYEVSSYDASSITFTRCSINSQGEAVVYKDVLSSSDVHTKSTSATLPAHSASDSGKVLGVNASGNTEWVTAGGGGGSDIVRLLSSNITNHQDYDNIVSEFTTKEVYIKPNDVYLDYDAYFRVIKATSSIITAELPVIEDLDNGKTRYTGIIRYNITKSSGDSLTKLPTYYFTLNINLQTLGIELYDSTKAYKQNDFVFVANPHTGSDVNSATWVYRAREDLPANVEPSMYPAAWQRLSLDDYYRHLKKISVTPDNGSIELFYTYEGKFIESTGDIQLLESYEGIASATIQWTVASYTTLPTVPSSWHASSSNPSSLTVGKTYQLRLVNNCYTIEEFN